MLTRWPALWKGGGLIAPPALTLPSCPLLQDLRRKAARLVAAKCTLAARVDSFHESAEGKVRGGRRLSGRYAVCLRESCQ